MNQSTLLSQVVDQASTKLQVIDLDSFNLKPSPSKWSKKEILGHLIDSCFVNLNRVVLAQGQQDYLFDGYDQDAWVRRNNYQKRDAGEVMTTWKTVNLHFAASVDSIAKDVLSSTKKVHNFHEISMIKFPKDKPASLAYLISDYIYHQEYHLKQILQDYSSILTTL